MTMPDGTVAEAPAFLTKKKKSVASKKKTMITIHFTTGADPVQIQMESEKDYTRAMKRITKQYINPTVIPRITASDGTVYWLFGIAFIKVENPPIGADV